MMIWDVPLSLILMFATVKESKYWLHKYVQMPPYERPMGAPPTLFSALQAVAVVDWLFWAAFLVTSAIIVGLPWAAKLLALALAFGFVLHFMVMTLIRPKIHPVTAIGTLSVGLIPILDLASVVVFLALYVT